MPEPLQNIDRFVYDELHDLNEDPKTSVWRKLEAQLDQQEEAEYRVKHFYSKRVAAVGFFLLSWFVIYEATYRPTNKTNSVTGFSSGNTDNERNTTVVSTTEVGRTNEVRSTKIHESTFLNKKFTGLVHAEPNSVRKMVIANTDNGISNGGKPLILIKPLQSNTPEEKQRNPYSIQPILRLPLQQNMDLSKKDVALKRTAIALPPDKRANKSSGKAAWIVTPWFATERTNYHLEEDVPDGTTVPATAYVDGVQSKERHEPSLSVGIKLEKQLTKNFWLQSGLSYAQPAIAIVPQTVIAEQNKDGSVGYRYNTSSGYTYLKPSFASNPAIGDSLSATEAQHNLSYVQVPVTLQWKRTVKRFAFSTGAGLGLNILTQATLETELKNVANKEIVLVDRLKGMKNMYADLLFNASVNYGLNKKISVNLSPYFRTALTSINKNNVVKTYPYSIGLAFGCSYKF